MPTVGGALT